MEGMESMNIFAALFGIFRQRGLVTVIKEGQSLTGFTISAIVVSIIGGLQASLDKTMDNDIVNNLDALYDFCIHHLLEANVNNEPQMLDDVLAVLNNIQEGWSGIREQALEQWKNN